MIWLNLIGGGTYLSSFSFHKRSGFESRCRFDSARYLRTSSSALVSSGFPGSTLVTKTSPKISYIADFFFAGLQLGLPISEI
jgi:hypothetical protein